MYLKVFFPVILIFIFSLTGPCLYAQDGNDYVYTFQDTMNLKLLLANRGLATVIQHTETDDKIRFTPNNLNYVGIGGYFWDFSVKLYFPLPLNWFFDLENLNQSNILDLQATLFRKNWFFEGAFQQYTNIYPQQLVDPLHDGREGEQPGFFTRRVIVNATYLFSGEQVSLKSPFSRNVVQARNAGSWLLTTGFSSIESEGENTLLPSSLLNGQGSDSPISEMSAVGIELRPGYAYNYGYKQFFMHASASAGAAFQYKLYKKEGQWERGLGIAPVYNFRAALGYDNGKYFGGISAMMNYAHLSVEELQIRQNSRNLQFFFGYRLAEPRWLQKLEPTFLKW